VPSPLAEVELRVDIPIVRNWLLDCLADLACPTKTA
jgi:hypothetical protein